jgi:hypothetical protein
MEKVGEGIDWQRLFLSLIVVAVLWWVQAQLHPAGGAGPTRWEPDAADGEW